MDTYCGADSIPMSRKATENKTKNLHFGAYSPEGKINNKQNMYIYNISSSDKCYEYNGYLLSFFMRDTILDKVIRKKS